MEENTNSFDMNKLKSVLGDASIQLSWTLCQNFITNLVERIPELATHIDIVNETALQTFQSADVSITIGSTSKPSRNDAETCQKILQSGANKGKKCSLARAANSEFCKRHLNIMMKSGGMFNDTKQKQVSSFRDIIGAKKQQRRSPAEMTLRPIEGMEDVYVDLNTMLLFEEIHGKIFAVGHLYGEDMMLLSKSDIKTCDINGWEYKMLPPVNTS